MLARNLTKRSFASLAAKDPIAGLYLTHLKAYVVPPPAKPDLSSSFSQPVAPPRPAVDRGTPANAVTADAEEQWPALYNAFQDKSLFEEPFDFSDNPKDDKLYPVRAPIVSPAPPASRPKVDPFEVGWLFVQEYYTFLNREPERLHCFYNKASLFTHGHEAENAKIHNGQMEIHECITSLAFQDCKVLVSQVDSQSSQNGGIIVQVLGEMSNNGEASHKFAQSFFLAEQASGYYVLNDIFRYLKEDIDNTYEETTADASTAPHHVNGSNGMNGATSYNTNYNVATSHEDVPQQVVAKKAAEMASPKKNIEVAVAEIPVKRSPSPKPRSKSPEKQHQPQQEVVAAAVVGEWGPPSPSSEEPTLSTIKSVTPDEVPGKAAAWAKHSGGGGVQQPANQQAARNPANAAPPPTRTWANLTAKNSAAPIAPVVVAKEQHQQASSASSVSGRESSRDHQREGTSGTNNNDTSSLPAPTPSRPAEEKDKHSIYIKHLAPNTVAMHLKDAFSPSGSIRGIDVLNGKNIAFVEFDEVEVVAKVIANGQVIVNGTHVTPEERKRQFNPTNRRNNGSWQQGRGGGGSQNGGRGGGGGRNGDQQRQGGRNGGGGERAAGQQQTRQTPKFEQ